MKEERDGRKQVRPGCKAEIQSAMLDSHLLALGVMRERHDGGMNPTNYRN